MANLMKRQILEQNSRKPIREITEGLKKSQLKSIKVCSSDIKLTRIITEYKK